MRRKDIIKYIVFNTFSKVAVLGALRVLFILSKGVTFLQYTFIMSLYNVFRIIMDIPLGVLADVLGKKVNLVIGSVAKVIYYIMLISCDSVKMIGVSHIILSIGDTALTGSKNSYLFESTNSNKDKDRFTRTMGNSIVVATAVNIILNIIGGFLYDVNELLPFFITLIALIIALLVSLTFDNSIETNKNNSKNRIVQFKDTIVSGYYSVKTSKELKGILLFSITSAVFLVVLIGLKQPYMEHIGLTGTQVGVIGALLQVGSIFAGRYSTWFIRVTKGSTFTVLIQYLGYSYIQ